MNKIFQVVTIVLLITLVVLGAVVIKNLSVSPATGGSTSDDWNVGGNLAVTGTSAFTGDVTLTDEIALGDETVKWEELNLTAGLSQICQQNTAGKLYIDLANMGWTSGTASSTYKMALIATTSSSIPTTWDYTTFVPYGASTTLLTLTTYATSTTATTTTSLITGLMPNGEAIVQNNQYVCLYIQQGFPTPQATCTGSVCETATSTNRGFNPYAKFRYHR